VSSLTRFGCKEMMRGAPEKAFQIKLSLWFPLSAVDDDEKAKA
jgi:hypothetical protein